MRVCSPPLQAHELLAKIFVRKKLLVRNVALVSEAASFAKRDLLTELAVGGAPHTINSLMCYTVELSTCSGMA